MNKKEIKEWIYTIVTAVILVVIIRTFILDTRVVPTTSMVPTIMPGDRLFVEKITYRLKGLERGEVIVFKPPASSGLKEDLIKRLIALPGDTVEIKDGKLYVNGEAKEEPYLNEPIQYTFNKMVVPPGKIFVLGDNRNRSYDSHEWKELADLDSVKGKAFITYWPLNRIKIW
ncbi:MAG: signal peptidase I [Peptococcaceae bacterium]|jgi:signal peptidase I|nr:signal peptidase I [Peptococcaceae bacterium]MDH7524572.1 signal peptidase I [Peptococcaceae bacterium]